MYSKTNDIKVQPNADLSEPCLPRPSTDQTTDSYPAQSTLTNCVSPFTHKQQIISRLWWKNVLTLHFLAFRMTTQKIHPKNQCSTSVTTKNIKIIPLHKKLKSTIYIKQIGRK